MTLKEKKQNMYADILLFQLFYQFPPPHHHPTKSLVFYTRINETSNDDQLGWNFHCECLWKASGRGWREVKVTQSFPALFNPMDCSPPGPSVHGLLQARILEWVAMPCSGKSSQPRDWTQVSLIWQILHHLSHWGNPPGVGVFFSSSSSPDTYSELFLETTLLGYH